MATRRGAFEKVYAGLTNRERAAIAFKFMADANEVEVARVADAVPRKSYIALEFDFRDGVDRLILLASCWCAMHWRLRADLAETKWALLAAPNVDKSEWVLPLFDRAQKCETRLLALDRALEQVCAGHGIDAVAVRKVGGAEPFDPLSTGLEPDVEYEREITDAMRRVVLAPENGPRI